MSTTPSAIVDQQPDTADTTGSSFLDSLEQTAVNTLNQLGPVLQKKVADSGNMPFDPNDPNFRSLVQVRNASNGFNVGTSGTGVLVILAIVWLWSRRGKS